MLRLGRCSGFFSGCGARASHRRGFSCCEAQALQGERASGVTVRGPRSCSSWTLEYRLSSRGAWAYWIFPDQRSDSCLLHWQVDSFPLNHQGSLVLWLFDAVVLTAALLPVPGSVLPPVRWSSWPAGQLFIYTKALPREFGMDMYTLLYLKWTYHRTQAGRSYPTSKVRSSGCALLEQP